MDYDRIILEMLDRIKSLEDEVAALKNNSLNSNDRNEPIKSSKKYRRLTELLTNAEGKPVSIYFGDIEKALGFSLPDSAREHRAFWANTTTHSIALSWLSIGYKTVDVDIEKEMVVFEKIKGR